MRGVSLLGGAMAALAIIIVAAAVVLQGPAVSRKLSERAEPGRIGLERGRVSVTAGPIPLAEFLKILSSLTGMPVLHDSTDPNLTNRDITVGTDIDDADENMIKAILEVNHIRAFRETLPSGREILKVEPMQPAPARKNVGGVRTS